jgi:acetyl esterase/lipase
LVTTTSEHPSPEIPQRLFENDQAETDWRARFKAARMSAPVWALDAPDANLYVSNASGVWEVYAWDRASDTHRQVTKRPNGTLRSTPAPDGQWIWWFNDTDGDEFGSWVREPFDGGEVEKPFPEVHDGYSAGLEIGRRVSAVGVSTDDGSQLFAQVGQKLTKFYEHTEDAGIEALSRNEEMLAIAHSEHGDSRHPALRVLSTVDFSVIAEKWDGKNKGLSALEFSPIAGDSRLLALHERHGQEEILIWDVEQDTEVEIKLDLPGEVAASWYPDAEALLVAHFHQGRSSLYRYELETARLTSLDTPPGRIGGASVRDDGSIEYSWSSAEQPSMIRTRATGGADTVLLTPPGDEAPHSSPLQDAFAEGPGGRVHALFAKPRNTAEGPLPTVFILHGGPHSADEDRFSAYRAMWLDAGFVTVEVNYRGSTGYGSAWRDAIEGRPGLTELEDVAAVHDWAVQSGLSDPAKCVVTGGSWGGYLTLLALGTQPQRWAVGIAGVPVADYVTAYEDEMEQLRSFDRALFGGSPTEVPDSYRECSPLTYVDAVKVPVLVLAGDNDPRCPMRQIENYLDRLAVLGTPYEFYRYDAGHGSLVVEETIKQSAIEVFFALKALDMR